ncbi:MAG: dipeptidase [Anaerovoracaceae bacterium]
MYFDAHSDIWTDITIHHLNGEHNVFHDRHAERLKKGGVEGSILVIWVDPPYDKDYAARTRDIMKSVREEISEAEDFRIVKSYSDITQAEKDGKIYILLGVEGLANIGDDPSRIDEYYEFGCRHAMLTWNEANALAAGAVSGDNYGLTKAGKKTVRMMQEKGMLVDTSHLNEAGFWDIIDLTSKPIVASHSNASALCGVPRNLTDDQLRAIAGVGGVVGLNAFAAFTDADPRKATVERLAEHAAHMIDVMGIDHVGLGFDFCEFLENEDTIASMGGGERENLNVRGMADATQIDRLFICFQKMGMSKEDMKKIARDNFRRVIRETIG